MKEFLREASFLKFLKHPNILPTIGIVWAKGDRPKVVLPYMALGDLCSLIRKVDMVKCLMNLYLTLMGHITPYSVPRVQVNL